jgi:preprotein translocase subunit SecG
MQQLTLILHVLTSIALIALVLLQYGKGADVGASFGSGASNTMFGSAGAVPFLTKVTGLLAAVFFVTSLGLGFMASQQVKNNTQLMSLPSQTQKPMQNK